MVIHKVKSNTTMVQAKVMNLHFDQKETAVQEATLEVMFENGDRQMFVVPILRMTEVIKAKPAKWDNKSADDML